MAKQKIKEYQKYIEANRDNLSPEQVRKVEDKLYFLNRELQKNIEIRSRTVDERFFIRVDLDEINRIIEQRLLLHIQNPRNPQDFTVVSLLPLEEELESRGYAEMVELVEQ